MAAVVNKVAVETGAARVTAATVAGTVGGVAAVAARTAGGATKGGEEELRTLGQKA